MAKKPQPETSLAAFRSLDPVQMAEIYQRILWSLGQIGEGTFEQIAVSLRLPKERVWKRLSELQKQGLIFRPGNKWPLSSGRLGYTWKLVVNGNENHKITEKSLPGKTVADYSKAITQLSLL